MAFVPAEIYIFRHGIESRVPGFPGLSEQGVARVRRQARGLARIGVTLDVILAGNDQPSRDTAAALAVGLLAARLIGAQQPLIFKKAAGCRIDIGRWA
jgi:hypothetical protein